MSLYSIGSQDQSSTLVQFYNDLRIDGCIMQIGTLKSVELLPKCGAEAVTYIQKNPSQNLYFLGGVDPSRNMERAGDEDILKKNHFFLDFDIRSNALGEITDDEIKKLGMWLGDTLNAQSILDNWRYIVFSGNGIHVHYLGAAVEVHSIEYWKLGMQKMIKMVEFYTQQKLDRGCVNVGRICRAPGSYNNKNGQRKVEILLMQTKTKMNIGYIEMFGQAREVTYDSKYQKVEKIEGDILEGSRNTTLTSLAGSLRQRGLDEATILTALSEVNTSKCKPPLSEEEVQRIAKSVASYPLKIEKHQTNGIRTPVVVNMEDVVREEVKWLWNNRIPYGKLTLLEGDPSVGKSTVSLAIASALTRGVPLYGDKEGSQRIPSKVLLLMAEDGLADTIRPRLDALEADPTRIRALVAVKTWDGKEQHFSIAEDLESLESELIKGGYGLMIIDPLNAYLGGNVDTNRDSDIRSILTPLTKLAEKYDVALICIRHLTKSPRDKAIYRGLGSIGYTAVARSVLLVGKNPLNSSERIIICTKNNLAPESPAIAFEITNDKRFIWRGERNMTAESLLAALPDENDQSAFDQAKEYLEDALSNGGKAQTDLVKEAKKLGISESTLRRAKGELRIDSKKLDKEHGYAWVWQLPAANSTDWSPWSSSEKELMEAEKDNTTNMTSEDDMAGV